MKEVPMFWNLPFTCMYLRVWIGLKTNVQQNNQKLYNNNQMGKEAILDTNIAALDNLKNI
jgi:hypothetical protein